MLRFTGSKLDQVEMSYLRTAAEFTLDKFISKYKQKRINVEVILVDDKRPSWGGECVYLGIEEDRKIFEIRIQTSLVKKRAKKLDTRMKDIVATLMHELIHVKQYVNNQLFDYADGKTVRYEGKVYKDTTDFVSYWESPWEIDAYGRTVGTYESFIRVLIKRRAEAKQITYEQK